MNRRRAKWLGVIAGVLLCLALGVGLLVAFAKTTSQLGDGSYTNVTSGPGWSVRSNQGTTVSENYGWIDVTCKPGWPDDVKVSDTETANSPVFEVHGCGEALVDVNTTARVYATTRVKARAGSDVETYNCYYLDRAANVKRVKTDGTAEISVVS